VEQLPASVFETTFDAALTVACQTMSSEEPQCVPHIVQNLREAWAIVSMPPLKLLQNIRKWALDGLDDQAMHRQLFSSPLEISSDGSETGDKKRKRDDHNPRVGVATRSLTARQARGVLANAFLPNLNDTMASKKDMWNLGGLNWCRLLTGNNKVGVHRMMCHLLYFEAMSDEASPDLDRAIIFERIRFEPIDFLNDRALGSSNQSPVGEGIQLHMNVMEHPTRSCSAFVNFANPNFGYGAFICSCTQEEILESCCPEITVGLLWMGKMADNEVVNVRNVRRFATYSGYLRSFQCQGPPPAQQPIIIQDVLTMDACYDDHFSIENIQRDLNKAYFAFKMHAAAKSKSNDDTSTGKAVPVISTGKWGCGAFEGQAAHKFVQQALAANLAGVDLEFSVHRDSEQCDVVLNCLKRCKPTAAQVAAALRTCVNERSFVQDLGSEL